MNTNLGHTTVGLIGFGEVGRSFAQTLTNEAHVSVGVFDTALTDTGTLALHDGGSVVAYDALADLCNASTIVIGAVPASAAVEVAKMAIRFLRPGALYVDVTASSPSDMEDVAQIYADAAVDFVDAAIMGPVPRYGHRVPMLAAGSGAAGFVASFNALGADVQLLPGNAGTSSAVKLCRSIFTKGLESIIVESFLLARALGVEAVVEEGLRETLRWPGLDAEISRYIQADALHAARRSSEMEAATYLAHAHGVEPIMAQATAKRLQKNASAKAFVHFAGAITPRMAPHTVVDTVREATEENTIVTCDAGAHRLLVSQLWTTPSSTGFFTSNGLATMGYALPAAIGAKLACPSRPVIAFTGDGGFLMQCQELATAVRENIPIVVVVFDDLAISLIKVKQTLKSLPPLGVDLSHTDYPALARGLGANGYSAETEPELRAAIRQALDSGRPSLIGASIDPSGYKAQFTALRDI